MTPIANRHASHASRLQISGRLLFIGPAILLLFLLPPMARAAALQTAPPPVPPTLNEALHPALDQVGSALNQIQIDHWKLPRDWKEELASDANSIQQDMSSQLPGLFQAAQQSPTDIAPQLSVLHNVDALYDVLVRISTAGGIAGGRHDSVILDAAVRQLESARKAAAGQILQAASLRDTEIARFKAEIAQATKAPANRHATTIVVDNRIGHPTRHHKATSHRKPAKPAPAAKTGTATPTPGPTTP